MDARDHRRPRRRGWTPALLLAVVALTIFIVASPAVAKPGHVAPAAGATLTTAGTIAVLAVAACAALVLVLLAVFTGRREGARQAAAERQPERARVQPTTSHRIAA